MELLTPLVWASVAGSGLTLVLRALKRRTAGSPLFAAVSLGAGVTALALDLRALEWATVILFMLGVWTPGRLMLRAYAHARRGHFARAAHRLQWAWRLRRLPEWRAVIDLWRALDAHFERGDPTPLHDLTAALRASDRSDDAALLSVVAAYTRDWEALRHGGPLDLHARALCELGAVEAGVEATASLWPRRLGWNALRAARLASLPALAFGGRVAAVAATLRAARIADATATLWLGTARQAAGEAEAETAVQAVAAQPPNGALAAAARFRLAHPAAPVALGPSAAAVLDDVAREAHAADLLRVRGLSGSPVAALIALSLAAFFGLEALRGGTENLATLRGLGGLLVGVDGPSWRLLAYGWLHYGALHLATNLAVLLLLAPVVEAALGGPRLALLWVGSVLGGGLSILGLGSPGLTIGASGGAMGLLGALVVITLCHPHTRGTRTARAGARLVFLALALQVATDLSLAQISAAGHLGGLATGALLTAGLLSLSPGRHATHLALGASLVLLATGAGAAPPDAAPPRVIPTEPAPAAARPRPATRPRTEVRSRTATGTPTAATRARGAPGAAHPPLNDAAALGLLDRLGDALRRGDGARAAACYRWSETARQLVLRGRVGLEALGPDFAARLAADRTERLAAEGPARHWRRTEIVEATAQPDGLLRVHVRHHRADHGPGHPHRYWLQPAADGLRIVDEEAVDTARRLTDELGLSLAAGRAAEPPVWLPALQALDALLDLRARGDLGALLVRLAELRRLPAPEPLAHQLGLLQAEALWRIGQPEEALRVVAALQTAARALPGEGLDGLPLALDRVAAQAYEVVRRCGEAQRAAERFLKHFPDDADAWATLGLCHGQSGRRTKIAAALGRALASDREHTAALGALVLYAPDGEDAHLAHRLRALDDTTRAAVLAWLDQRAAPRARARLERLLP